MNSTKNIKMAFLLNLFFAILEAIGGILTNSISILSDSVHDLGDSISIGLSYFFEKKSSKKSDNKYTYGYLRYSLIGALITSFILLLGSFFVIYEAIPRIINPEEVNYNGMLIFAIFGVLINGYAAYKTSKGNGQNEKAVSLHMFEDVLGWVAVLIGSLVMKLFNFPIIDPILSIIISLYILYHAYRNLKEVFVIFMDKVPDDIDVQKMRKELLSDFKEIKDIHHIHVWSLNGINNYMTMHVVLCDNVKEKEIISLKHEIREKMINKIDHITIEIEYSSEHCSDKTCKINHEC